MQSYTAYGFGSQIGITICALHNLPHIKKTLAIEILRQGKGRPRLVLAFLETDRSHPIVTRLAVRVDIGQFHHIVVLSEFLDLLHRAANVLCPSFICIWN